MGYLIEIEPWPAALILWPQPQPEPPEAELETAVADVPSDFNYALEPIGATKSNLGRVARQRNREPLPRIEIETPLVPAAVVAAVCEEASVWLEPGKQLVEWVNGLPGAQEVLKEQFGGRAVTEQNLSEWKQGGYQEWLRQEETRSLVSQLTEQSDDLDEAADGMEISDRYASVLAVELIRQAMTRLEKETDPEKRWQIICEVHRELSQFQRDGHRAVRTRIKRDRWNREVEREEEEDLERMKQEHRKHLTDLCFSEKRRAITSEVFGGGEYGEKMAELLHRIRFDLPLPDFIGPELSGKTRPVAVKPNPTESDPIQPNQTNVIAT